MECRFLLSAAPISPNLDLTGGTGIQQDPSIAVDPHNSQHLVEAYMDYSLLTTGYAGIATEVSENGGATWSKSEITLPSDFDQGAASPIVAFDNQGNVFVSFSAATFKGTLPGLTDPDFFTGSNPNSERSYGLQSNNGIFVAESTDGGSVWSAPVAVTSNLFNGTDPVNFEVSPQMAIDTYATLPGGGANPYYEDLYVVWTQIYAPGLFPGDSTNTGGTDAMIAVSSNHGATWTTEVDSNGITAIDDPVRDLSAAPAGLGYVDQPHVTIGPEGGVYVGAYGGGDFSVFYSSDGGQTFTAPTHNDDDNLAFGDGFLSSPFNGELNTNNFRTNPQPEIVADPNTPGTVYAVETISTLDTDGNLVDEAEVNFAKSTDYGLDWSSTFTIGNLPAQVLNDENGGIKPSGSNSNDVIAGDAFAQLSVGAQGNLAVIWYDTRVDPNNHLLNVFGTVSTDGGANWSPNFRITTQSFDANNGAFTDASGQTNYYLGDYIGLAMAGGNAYATWDDTINGNQDIYFSSFTVNPAPPPLNNRFEPNSTPSEATQLGTVFQSFLPQLELPAGDTNWYSFTAAATGQLTLNVAQYTTGSQEFELQLWNSAGTTLLATGTTVTNSAGEISGEAIDTTGSSGTSYLVKITPVGAGGEYSLATESITANLGTQVYGVQNNSLAVGDQDYYQLTAPASGTLQVQLTGGSNAVGNFSLEILNATTQAVLASGTGSGTSQSASITVNQGQTVLLFVSGDSSTSGNYSLTYTNLDQDTVASSSEFIPAGTDPSQLAVADLSNNGIDDIVVANAGSDTVSVLMGNGDGTFQAPRQYSVGPYDETGPVVNSLLPRYRRSIAIADLTGNGIPDIIVTNYDSGDVSVLLGNGDGTFQPARTFNAVPDAFALAVGDLTNNGIQDLVVASANASPGTNLLQISVGVLLGRGDGTFLPPGTFNITLPAGGQYPMTSIQLADLNGDGLPDLVVSGGSDSEIRIFYGNGDGTFTAGPTYSAAQLGTALLVTDLNPGVPEIINASYGTGTAFLFSDNGDGTFSPDSTEPQVVVGQAPVALAMADLGSDLQDGTANLGPPDGNPDLIVVNSGVEEGLGSLGPPDVVVLPTIYNNGVFGGFGAPDILYTGIAPLDVAVGDFNGDGVADIAIADSDGVHIVFGQTPTIVPNTTPQAARNLGAVVHVVEPTLSIVPGNSDAYFNLTAPTEADSSAGDEVLDFSGLFQNQVGSGLNMQLLDASGTVLASGERFQVAVQQGESLTLHVFGKNASAAGAYTLDIDALPQVVSVAAQSVLPGTSGQLGGPATSLVVTFQGERLDASEAENPANYQVIWLGAAGSTGVDQTIPLGAGQSVIYDPGANVDVTTGITYPTAVKQTVTLLFDSPLPVGSYEIKFSPNIVSAAFNNDETSLLAEPSTYGDHSLVSVVDGQIVQGAQLDLTDLVTPAGPIGSFTNFASGTPFLTQLHADLGALLDSDLTENGDQPTITPELLDQLIERIQPGLDVPGVTLPPLMVLFLDPVSLDLSDPNGDRVNYDLQTNAVSDQASDAFVSVSGNVEVVVQPVVPGQFTLDVANVPQTSRGGVVLIDANSAESVALTDALRGGSTQFNFGFAPIISGADSQATAATPATPPVNNNTAPAAAASPIRLAEAVAEVSLTSLLEGTISSGQSNTAEQNQATAAPLSAVLPPKATSQPSPQSIENPPAPQKPASRPSKSEEQPPPKNATPQLQPPRPNQPTSRPVSQAPVPGGASPALSGRLDPAKVPNLHAAPTPNHPRGLFRSVLLAAVALVGAGLLQPARLPRKGGSKEH
ncbi:MAG: FG-GAP-like repeat-containing protein [Tepidisphaeraceae bacterium]